MTSMSMVQLEQALNDARTTLKMVNQTLAIVTKERNDAWASLDVLRVRLQEAEKGQALGEAIREFLRD